MGTTTFGQIAQKTNGSRQPDFLTQTEWEESEQTDIGIDLGFFDNALYLLCRPLCKENKWNDNCLVQYQVMLVRQLLFLFVGDKDKQGY